MSVLRTRMHPREGALGGPTDKYARSGFAPAATGLKGSNISGLPSKIGPRLSRETKTTMNHAQASNFEQARHDLRNPWKEQQGSPPLVSVVIPCYNQAHFLSEAIESVLAQTHPNFEIIVVDDGSTDNTSEVAARYPGVRHIRQDNQGLAAARNTGLRESKGTCLVFLDADDRLLPNA